MARVVRVVAVLFAVAVLQLAGAVPAGAATKAPGGTLDLRNIDTPGTNVASPTGPIAGQAFVGDVNGGKGDIAIGVPTADPGGRTDAGSVYVLYGAGGDFAAVDLANLGPRSYRIDGAKPGDRLGASIEPLGYDLGGDKLDDFAIGAPGAGSANAGAVYLVPGSKERAGVVLLSDDKSIVGLTGAPAGSGLGQTLSAPPTTHRLIVGAPRADPGGLEDAGSVFVLMDLPGAVPDTGKLSLSAMDSFRLDGRVAGGRAGASVGWSLDFDGDGRTEVLVGAPGVAFDARTKTSAGEAYIVPFGSKGDVTTLGSPGRGGVVVAGEPGMGLGASVAGLGDLTRDTLADVAIGAPTASPGARFKAGSAVVVLGRPEPAMPIAGTAAPGSVVRIDGAAAFDSLGTAVASVDLADGGGHDLLVSAPRANALGRMNAGATYALLGSRIAAGTVDIAQLGDAGVRVAGREVEGRSGTGLAVSTSDRTVAMAGGRASLGLFVAPAPAPVPAIATSQVGACTPARDIELVVDGSPSMKAADPDLRTAIDAMLSKPRSAPINLGAIEIGQRMQQVFAPLTLPAAGLPPNGRDLATLRLLLAENIDIDVGPANYTAGLFAAAAARPQASALVLVTDASQPPPAVLAAPLGRRVYVLMVGSHGAPSAAGLEDLAARTGGKYREVPDVTRLPAELALAEAVLACEQILTTQATRTEGGLVGELTLSPSRRRAAFDTRLKPTTKTATLTFSFPPGTRTSQGRRCAGTSPVSLQGLEILDSNGKLVAEAQADQVQRALRGRPTTFATVLRVSGRCGRGFQVLEVSGLERLGGAQALAAASSPPRLVRTPIRLERPPVKRRVKAVSIGSSKRKGRRS